MPRMGRLVVEGYPHHVVQRGHNRQVVFASEEDHERYLSDIRELKEAFGIKLYAYCLMTNHVHLLVDPRESPAALGGFMKTLPVEPPAIATAWKDAVALFGKAATNPAWSRPTPISWPAVVTSNSTPYEPTWCPAPRPMPGLVPGRG